MNELERLIQELCPDGVQFYELQEVFDIKNGYTPSKANTSFWENGTLPWFRMEDIRENGRILSDSLQHITPEAVKGTLFPPNSIIVATSATIGEHALITVESLANQRFTYLTPKKEYVDRINPMYAYYYCFKLDEWCLDNTNISSFASVDMAKFVRFKIPVPPLPVQSEIVRILDNFAELTARKKQYEYYASELFANSSNNLVSMSELADFVYGYTDKASDTGDTRFIRITDINEQGCLNEQNAKYITLNEEARKSLLSKGDLIMARTGATFGKTLYFDSDEQSVYASFLIKIIPDRKRLNNRFYWHFTKTPLYWEQANKLVSTGGQPQFNTPALKQIKIYLPPLEEQERIVAILDRFDALCNDLTSGLPAEIEARRKQYEYYRDKLLSFRKIS